jgi:hypothetical protein
MRNVRDQFVCIVISESGMSLAPPSPLQDFVKFWLGQSQDIKGHDFSLRPLEKEVLEYLDSISPSISKYEDCQKWVRAWLAFISTIRFARLSATLCRLFPSR